MKKLFFTLVLVATSVAAMADRWVAPSRNVYPDETPLFVTVAIDELADTYVPEVSEIAAFVDVDDDGDGVVDRSECRAQATAMTDGRYILRVRGKMAEDNGKTITIKALYKGLVYTLSTSEKFDGEADAHAVPLALTLQPLLGIDLVDDPIEMTLGGDTYNLAEKLVYSYGHQAGSSVSCSPIDLDETPLTVTYQWDPKSERGYIDVSSEGIVTALAVTNGAVTNAFVTVSAATDEYQYTPYFEKRVQVIVSLPTVTGIQVNPTELNVHVGDNLQTLIREGKLTISLTPADANQAYSWRTNAESLPWDGNGMFTTPGDYQVEVYSVDNTNVAATVTFHVTLPPVTAINVRPLELTVHVGDNLQTLIDEKMLVISMQPVYADQSYDWEKVGERLPWDGNKMFDAVGDYQAKVYSLNNPDVSATVTFHVTLPPVTQIVVRPKELNVYVGDNLNDLISQGKLSISMLPALADQRYRLVANTPTAPWDEAYNFTSVGDFEVSVYSTANPDLAPETVTFHVALPPVTQIVVTPTELTVYVGDNLDVLIRQGRLSISMLPINADPGYDWLMDGGRFPWNDNYIFDVAGDYTARVYSTGNRDLQPVTVTFHVKEPLTFTLGQEAYNLPVGMIESGMFKVYTNTNEGFDPSLLALRFIGKMPISPVEYKVGALMEEETSGRYYVEVTLTGRYLGEYEYDVLYNGKSIVADARPMAIVLPEVQINEGWQWVSPYAYEAGNPNGDICPNGKYVDWINNLIEMRTQEHLLYVDAKLGAFGDITQFNFTEGMYKVKSNTATVLRLASDQTSSKLAQYNARTPISHGYNWVVYPYEFALTIEETGLVGHEGDQIICKDGKFAEYSEGAWTSNDLTFQPGVGYMYYYTGVEDTQFDVSFDYYANTPACYSNDAPARAEMGGLNKIEPVWTIDHSRFADVMTVVAEVEGLTNAEEWVLGAFVGDECRGEGRCVRDDIMFIGIAGKNGEKMNFRLHNTRTGEEFDVSEALSFRQKAGSLKAPLRLTSEGATGISSVNTSANADNKAVYDLNGRRVAKPAKGVYVVGGRKVVF